jgi:hypothetical protein
MVAFAVRISTKPSCSEEHAAGKVDIKIALPALHYGTSFRYT